MKKTVTGKYNKIVKFRIPYPTIVDGLEKTAYTDGAMIWASAEPLKGREFWEAQAVQQESIIRFKMRYVSGVSSAWRLQCENIDYDIIDIQDPELRHRELWILCKAVK